MLGEGPGAPWSPGGLQRAVLAGLQGHPRGREVQAWLSAGCGRDAGREAGRKPWRVRSVSLLDPCRSSLGPQNQLRGFRTLHR